MEKKFFNIFQKKETSNLCKANPMQKIIIDYREKNCLVASELMKLGLEIEFQELKVGDYLIKNIFIERKTISDFISSMLNGRMKNQIENLKQIEKKLLIIEGFEEEWIYNEQETSGLNPNAIRGFLLSIILRHNIPLIFTKNARDTAKYLYLISKKQEKSQEKSLNIPRKNLSKQERKRFILEGFEGIGPNTSKKILKKFGSIKNAINSDNSSLEETIGKKKAQKFKEILDERY